MPKEKAKSKALTTKKDDANFAMVFGEPELKLIKETITPGATQSEFNLFVYDAQSRGLNPLRKEMYWIQRMVYDPKAGKKVNRASHQVGIDGFRKIAQSTNEYEGQTKVIYGEDFDFGGKKVPVYAEVGVYRKNFKEPLYARAYFEEYAQSYNGKLGSMWEKMPRLMIAKCAESLALRKAFPDCLSGLYTSDEMGQANNKVEDVSTSRKQEDEKKPKFKEVDAETGEIKEEKPQCATRSQEKKFDEVMDRFGLLMSWTPKKTGEMKAAALEGLGGADKFEDLSEAKANSLIKRIEERVEEKEGAPPAKVEEGSVTAEDVAQVFGSTVQDVT